MLRQNLKSESDYDEERCWQTGKGLRVWNVAQQGIPRLNSDELYAGVDVVLITASSLQVDPIACWVTKTKWHTVLADEGHDYLRGQHNARPGELSLTLRNWYNLQNCTKSMFIITGTPFVTKVSYDFVAITKSIAKESIRAVWGPEFTNEGLEKLVKGWRSDFNPNEPIVAAQQEEIRKRSKDLLAMFMIRRDQNSKIRGKPVMVDYFKQCTIYDQPLQPNDGGAEFSYREELYRRSFGANSNILTKSRNDNMRCLCWSYRFIPWNNAESRNRHLIWKDYTLREAMKQIRTKQLIKILKEGKRTGNGVILFVQRVFLTEMCIK